MIKDINTLVVKKDIQMFNFIYNKTANQSIVRFSHVRFEKIF